MRGGLRAGDPRQPSRREAADDAPRPRVKGQLSDRRERVDERGRRSPPQIRLATRQRARDRSRES